MHKESILFVDLLVEIQIFVLLSRLANFPLEKFERVLLGREK